MTIVGIDVTKDESVKKAYEEISAELKQRNEELHAVIINNNDAGTVSVCPIEGSPISELWKQLEVKSIGSICVIKQFIPLIRSSNGRIVNVNSLAGRHATPGLIGVCMTEAASLSLTDGLRREMYQFGVKVISVETYIPNIMQSSGETNSHLVPEAIRHAVMNKYPLHQYTVTSWSIWFLQLIPLYAGPQEIREMVYNLIPHLVTSDRKPDQVAGTSTIPPITFDLVDDRHTD